MKQQIPVSVTPPGTPPAVVCTLDASDFQERGLEWSDLSSLLLTAERIEGGVATTYPLNVLAQVEDLANREISCCGSWLSTNVTQDGTVVRLELTTTNPDGLGLILAMTGAVS